MNRQLIFAYGVTSYAIFFGTFIYAMGFVGGIGVPKSLDSASQGPVSQGLSVNMLVLGLFAIQHSVMARPAFKEWWTRFVPKPMERSTYVLLSSLALIILFICWQPLGGMIWDIKNTVGRGVCWALFAFGWLLVLVSSFWINHYDLFGLRQVWLHLKGEEYSDLPFKTPWLYNHVRHPLYVGWFFAIWATPTMTAAHLVFAVTTAVYILVAVRLEERDLVAALPEYADYQRRVPMLIPTLKRRDNSQDVES